MLQIKEVRKRYGPTVAVDGISLSVRAGEVFGLLGPNGAGKSTTIAMAVGLLRPDSGDVAIEGLGSPADPEVRRAIGLAPQTLALYDDLTGAENLSFFGSLYGIGGAALAGRVDAMLEFVGLADRRKHKVKTYSGGMKRRLNLAAALVHEPRILFLDEPTAGVDPQSRNAIFENIRELQRRGLTVIYTTHYMEEAQRLCDRVGVIDRGRLLAVDTVAGLIGAHGGRPSVVILTDEGETTVETDDPLAEAARALRDGGAVRGVRVENATLESVFLSLTGRSLRD